MRVFDDLDAFVRAEGEHLGFSDWVTVPQSTIDTFAEATGDRQWIHVDRERAAEGPFGTTIAHGYLTLSLIPVLMASTFSIHELGMGVNYGLDRVRFPSALPSGTKVRGAAELVEASRSDRGVLCTIRVTITADGADRPACVADTLTLFA